ncbi:MAG: DUF4199 domain-containing protein [Crocinitomicaceae bacterium]|nr:DUF4199 domain-containing protein [Crocinitomicaceae bacterium]NGF76878.1 DUF4199 domain-containing protein [Fluviicola sp. SGL-29]
MKALAIEIKWAVIFVVVSLLWMVLEKVCGLHGPYIDYHLYLTNLFAIPAIWMFVLALKDKKRRYYNGHMTYVQGLVSGTIISVIVAALSPLTQWVVSYVITPEYFPNVIKRSVELGYYETTTAAAAYFNYKHYATQGIIGALVTGIATTAIVMLFVRSKNRTVKQ